MDDKYLDSLARSASATDTRRAVLQVLVATIGGLLTTGVMTAAAGNRNRSKNHRKGKKRRKGATPQKTSKSKSATCADGIKNGIETDIDCGGGECPRCGTGKTCATRNDCASARCLSGVCQTCDVATTDCGTDVDGNMCACRDHVSGQRFCTKINGRLLPVGTPCTACQGGEQCFPINGGASGIECILPCGA